MCDYSLENYSNRQANEGESLVVKTFDSNSKGLVNKQTSGVAVCVLPGTTMVLRDLPQGLREQAGVTTEEAEVTFDHINIPNSLYHDGIRFENGYEMLLQRLPDGLAVDIIATPKSERNVSEMVNAAEDEVRQPVPVNAGRARPTLNLVDGELVHTRRG